MTPSHSWFPTSLQERAAWFQNFATNLGSVAGLLGLDDAVVPAVTQDNAWMQFIAKKSVEIDAFKKAVREYRVGMTQAHTGGTSPECPAAPAMAPPTPPPVGVFQRLSELVKRIRVASAYTDDIGALLGIIPSQRSLNAPEHIKPQIRVSGAFTNYRFTIRVARLGMDSFKVQVRRMDNEEWADAAFGTSSPLTIEVAPTAPGKPERVQVRAVLISRNTPVGQPSDPTYVTVNP